MRKTDLGVLSVLGGSGHVVRIAGRTAPMTSVPPNSFEDDSPACLARTASLARVFAPGLGSVVVVVIT